MFIPYKFADGHTEMIEVTDDLAAYLLKSDRELANAERRERYWCPVSLDAMPYEGETVACHETPEDILIREEERKERAEALSVLTDAQYRRAVMKMEGKTLRQIAVLEGTSVRAVRASLLLARKKLENQRKKF